MYDFFFFEHGAFIFHIMKADGDWSGPALKMAKKVSESSSYDYISSSFKPYNTVAMFVKTNDGTFRLFLESNCSSPHPLSLWEEKSSFDILLNFLICVRLKKCTWFDMTKWSQNVFWRSMFMDKSIKK